MKQSQSNLHHHSNRHIRKISKLTEMSEIKSLILKELSTYHRDGLIKHTHNYFKSKQLEEENRKSEESKPMEK